MSISEDPAAQEGLAQKFEQMQKEFYDEVDSLFIAGNKPRGNASFQSWEDRFLRFLDSELTGLSTLYKEHLSANRGAGLAMLTIHQNWKRMKGEGVETFLEQCISDARAGHLNRYLVDKVTPPLEKQPSTYIDTERLNDLSNIKSTSFDLSRLVRLCQEINISWSNGCYYATVVLVRSVLDHVPSVFQVSSFAEVANNYRGTKSFKESMQNLENSSRKIADSTLHSLMRSSETVITPTQANFSQDLDVLLSEIVRILKSPSQ